MDEEIEREAIKEDEISDEKMKFNIESNKEGINKATGKYINETSEKFIWKRNKKL